MVKEEKEDHKKFKYHTEKHDLTINPWHSEYVRTGPARMVITQRIRTHRKPVWYKIWESVPRVIKEHVKIHKRKKTTPDRNLEHITKRIHEIGKKEGIPTRKPSARSHIAVNGGYVF